MESDRTGTSLTDVHPAMGMARDEQAKCYFMSNFAIVNDEGNGRGLLDFIGPLIKREPQGSCLWHAFNACSYAALGNRVNSNSFNFTQQALVEVMRATSGVYSALQDTTLAKRDSTLGAIMLLGTFEVCMPTIPPLQDIVYSRILSDFVTALYRL